MRESYWLFLQSDVLSLGYFTDFPFCRFKNVFITFKCDRQISKNFLSSGSGGLFLTFAIMEIQTNFGKQLV